MESSSLQLYEDCCLLGCDATQPGIKFSSGSDEPIASTFRVEAEMKATGSTKMLATFYLTTRYRVLEDILVTAMKTSNVLHLVKYEALMAMTAKTAVAWDVMLYNLIGTNISREAATYMFREE
jgi:hypothetical protein